MTWPPPNIDWFYHDDFTAIACGDCREVLPKLPKVDLCLTDPPYGIGYDARGGGGSKNSLSLAKRTEFKIPTVHDDDKAFDPAWLFDCGDRQMIWGAHCFYTKLPLKGRFLVWKKRETAPGKEMDFADAEICFDSKAGLLRVLSHAHNGFVRDLGDMDKPIHPTQKPLSVMTWCLGLAPEAKLIADPYMGSGTTLVAAKQMGIRAIGIEREEFYCEWAAKRLQQEYLPLLSEPTPTVQEVVTLI